MQVFEEDEDGDLAADKTVTLSVAEGVSQDLLSELYLHGML